MHTEQELLAKGIKATVVQHPLVQHKLTLMRAVTGESGRDQIPFGDLLLCRWLVRKIKIASIRSFRSEFRTTLGSSFVLRRGMRWIILKRVSIRLTGATV